MGLTSGEVRELPGKFGELPGRFGKLPGNLWIPVKFHSERTSGEVAEKLPGKSGELPGKSGDFPEARGSLTPSQRLAKFVSKMSATLVICSVCWQSHRNCSPAIGSCTIGDKTITYLIFIPDELF